MASALVTAAGSYLHRAPWRCPALHQAIVDLFRTRRHLAAELLATRHRVALPDRSLVPTDTGTLAGLGLTHRCNLELLHLGGGEPLALAARSSMRWK